MTRKFWEVGEFIGRTAEVKLVDFSSGSWGHINFDDLRGDITCSAPENTGTYISVGFKSFKLRYPMCVYCVATQTSRRYEWLDQNPLEMMYEVGDTLCIFSVGETSVSQETCGIACVAYTGD